MHSTIPPPQLQVMTSHPGYQPFLNHSCHTLNFANKACAAPEVDVKRAAWLSLLVLLAGGAEFLLLLRLDALHDRDPVRALTAGAGGLIAFVVLFRAVQALSRAWRQENKNA